MIFIKKFLVIILAISIVINIFLLFNLNNNELEQEVELTLERLIYNAAFQIKPDMTEDNVIRMNQIFDDIELLSRSTMDHSDHSVDVWQNVSAVNEILSSIDYHILELEPGIRKEISDTMRSTTEDGNVNELEQRIFDIIISEGANE